MTNKDKQIELINTMIDSLNAHVESTIERANLMIDIARATNDSELSELLLNKAERDLFKVLNPLREAMDSIEASDQEVNHINEKVERSQELMEWAKSFENSEEVINVLAPVAINMLLN
ncbi:hypothetical protein G7084_00275 [Weissella coleopterorum]|uniref:Uncharacterized protein n=1 Tax=Weissella coleopterorum TaxID=2714949 RepID=A0A6G8AY62_9LACO|nr:hypothetical protein [Weissella coleopterorum]QIL49895.1 hypothetical protein G7084_00275 [Weissella coleopterorum]